MPPHDYWKYKICSSSLDSSNLCQFAFGLVSCGPVPSCDD